MSDLVDYLREKLDHADDPMVIHVGQIAIGDMRVTLWPGDTWVCRQCPVSGRGNSAAWQHLATHLPVKRKRWWRR